MGAGIKYGFILGIAVGALGFALPSFGLHSNMVMPTVFVVLAIAINVVVVFLALRETADIATWSQQWRNSVVVGVIGAVIIFASSWVMTVVVFPDYYTEYAVGMRDSLVTAGLPPDQIDAQMAALAQTTPVSSAMSGAVGAMITSLVAGALIGIFKRRAK